jgi:thymidylate synthase
MLAGRNDVAPLAYYNKRMREYSDDGVTLNGAYGYRWRRAEDRSPPKSAYDTFVGGGCPAPVDQLDVIIDHLTRLPDSRRAVLSMWNVEDDLLKVGSDLDVMTGKESKDVCCNLLAMFSLRSQFRPCTPEELARWGSFDGHQQAEDIVLDMTVVNRSNDLIWGLLGANYVHFSVLQEYMAARLGVEVGRYSVMTNNLHVYKSNWRPAEWLADHDPDVAYSPAPLVQDARLFDKQVPLVLNYWDGGDSDRSISKSEVTEPFLWDVARPMFSAFRRYKRGKLEHAKEDAEEIGCPDWRRAAREWLENRGKHGG